MIDALADNNKLLLNYKNEYKAYSKERRDLEKLIKLNQEGSREFDYLSFLLEEFNAIDLVEGEQNKIETELSRLSSAEDIKKNLGGAHRILLNSEHSIIGQLEEVNHALSPLKEADPTLTVIATRFESV